MSGLHLRNGRDYSDHRHTFGQGTTWCGKKLVGRPIVGKDCDVWSCYGAELLVVDDPARSTCEHCNRAFDAAYAKAFPEGLKPIATFKLDDPADMDRARKAIGAEALAKAFGPAGRGMDEVLDNLRITHE